MVSFTFTRRIIFPLFLAGSFLAQTPISAQGKVTPFRQVRFIENKGQISDMQGNAVPFVFYKASAPGLELYVTEKGLTYSFMKDDEEEHERKEKKLPDGLPKVHQYKWDVVNLELVGATIRKQNIVAEEQQQGAHNFYTNRFPQGLTNVYEYGKITITGVYPGIDWVLYNTGAGGFKYDFILHPGSDADDVRLAYTALSEARLTSSGSIELATSLGTLKEDKPVSYLATNKAPIGSAFTLISSERRKELYTATFGVTLNGRQTTQAAVIDPQLTWSTFYGGTSFEGTMATEVDHNGNLFICGYGASSDFPYYNSGTYFQGTGTINAISFISKFSANGVLLWATNYENASHRSMGIDPVGNIFVTGSANANIPVQNNNTYFQATSAGSGDAYILKFDNLGNRVWATFFGGSSYDMAASICADHTGNVFLTGTTTSTNFPLANANTYYVSTMPSQSGFIAKFSNSGNLLWSTFYAGLNPYDISNDNNGNVLITGSAYSNFTTSNPGSGAYFQSTQSGQTDAVVLKFTNAGALTWATYFGGNGTELGTSIAANKNGKVYLTGTTSSYNLPLQNAGGFFSTTSDSTQDCFVARFSTGGALEWSTYLGSSGQEYVSTYDNLATDSCDNVYVSFETASTGLPVQLACDAGYYDGQFDSIGTHDIYLARFDHATNLTWATYVGGNSYDFRATLAVDKLTNLYMSGEWVVYTNTPTPNYPIVNPGNNSHTDSTANGSDDVYIVRFGASGVPQSLTYDGPICTSSGTFAPLSASLIAGGKFTSAPGLSVHPVTGVIYPNSSLPGTYTVTYNASTSVCSCPQGTLSASTSATIQLLAGPSLSVAGSNTPCPGQVATRTVSGAFSYNWSNGFQATILSIKPSTTTVLTVTGTATNGCSSVYTVTIYVKPCAGLDEETLPGVKVYPNPNTGTFMIEAQQPAELVLSNMLGQQVRTIRLEKEAQQVEIKDLPKGVYILKDIRSQTNAGLRIVVD